MLTEDLPIDVYIKSTFNDKDITAITDGWRVENEVLISIISGYFKDLGIYRTNSIGEEYLKKQILFLMFNAPEIVEMIRTTEANEMLRNQSKHADI